MLVVALLLVAAASPAEEPVATSRLALHGFADVVYAHDFNRPADHATFFAGAGSAAKRHGEVSLNQAQVELSVDPAPVGLRLALGFGTALEVVHAGEPAGAFAGATVFRNVLYASALYKAPVGRGLVLEAGIFPAHVGFEGFNTKDNWSYTRSWLAELSPYYSAGVRARYSWSDRWSAELHVLNGWQTIVDNNSAKTLGTQIAYGAGRLQASFNMLAGPELPGNDDDWRVLGDLVVSVRATSSLSVGANVDLAREGRSAGAAAHWYGVGGYLRVAPAGAKTALALRLEHFDDADGAISATAQRLSEATLTLEHRPAPNLIVKLEGRYDRSTAAVFAGEAMGSAGSSRRRKDQLLILLGVVAAF